MLKMNAFQHYPHPNASPLTSNNNNNNDNNLSFQIHQLLDQSTTTPLTSFQIAPCPPPHHIPER
jgi:hypothetical protein